MDKNEEGTTMITAPEGVEEFNNVLTGRYYSIDEVPKEYRRYVEQVCDIQELSEYSFIYSKIIINNIDFSSFTIYETVWCPDKTIGTINRFR